MKKISWKPEGHNLHITYYCDSFLTCAFHGSPKLSEITIDPSQYGMSQTDFVESIRKYLQGALVQEAFPPTVPAELREFFITGLTSEEQQSIFGAAND